MEHKIYTMDFAGKPLTLEFGRYCEQANGSVWVHHGDTVVMARSPAASSSVKDVLPRRPPLPAVSSTVPFAPCSIKECGTMCRL